MQILIVSQYYYPEDYGAGVMVEELAEALAQLGNDITVLTGMPSYPHGKITPPYQKKLFVREEYQGVTILRSYFLPSSRTAGSLMRGLSALSFGLSSLISSAKVSKPDIILSFSPPIFMGLASWLMSRKWKVPFVVNVKDLFTRSILAGKLARKSVLTDCLNFLEHLLYRKADRIITNAYAFIDYFQQNNIPIQRISLIPDWADEKAIFPLSLQNSIRKEWHLEDNFVVLYSGNMGYFSDLETVILAAEATKDILDLQYILVGDGVKRSMLEQMVIERQLTNVQFRPIQTRQIFPSVLAAADIALVTLSTEGGQVSTQGKIYSIMAAGRPVVAVIPPENEISPMLNAGHFGWCSPSGDSQSLANLIRLLYRRREEIHFAGDHARKIFEEQYSLRVCAGKFETVLSQMSMVK